MAGVSGGFAETSRGLNYDVIVIGGGAAGLFCAQVAGRRGRRVLVLEHQARLGNKILISGGGRCNFTNLGATAANYVTHGSPHFPKSALARYPPQDFLALVERHGIAWHERKHRQLFCNHSSKQILQLLADEGAAAGVEVRLNCRILRRPAGGSWMVDRIGNRANPASGRYQLATTAGPLSAHSLVIATGGLSFPQLGATPFGCEIAQQFGVKLVPARPGLVPLTWSAAGKLSGTCWVTRPVAAHSVPRCNVTTKSTAVRWLAMTSPPSGYLSSWYNWPP